MPGHWAWYFRPEDVGQISMLAAGEYLVVRCSQCSRPLPPDAALQAARGRTAIGAGRAAELGVCARCTGSSPLRGPRDREAGRYYEERSASRSRSPRGRPEDGLVVIGDESP